MKLEPVESSMIQSAGYDEESYTLEVVFNSGKTYRYFEVRKTVYLELMESDSKGSYMLSDVIDCFPYEQVNKRRR
ncbi:MULTISPECIES: KTSC domain-containing protein [unclassified Microcoleus]|uniref:KTSC domain-containing protein n=1 Tax=unclassified Microcoleus TaxID=2642155 RepID=UPI002FD21642